jgi:hypothetical protein
MPPSLRIDTHVHVATFGPDRPPLRPAAGGPPFMEPQSERGAMTLTMRGGGEFKVFLFYNKIQPHEVTDALLRKRSLDNIYNSSFDYVVCLALDAVYTSAGERSPDRSAMWVSNEFVLELAAEFKAMLTPEERGRRGILLGASVHPYAPNFRERVAWCVDNGAVLLKWLPSAQQFTLADERVAAALEFLATARNGKPLPVLIHTGTELAIRTTDPKTTSYDFLSWSTWDGFWNRLRSKAQRWDTPDIAGVRRSLDRGLKAGGCVILAHCGLPYFAPNFIKKWLEHSDLDAVQEYVEQYRGTDGIRGKCFADASAVVTPFRKGYFDKIGKLPRGSVLAASDFPVPVFELSADLGENLEDLGAILNGEFERIIVPEGNMLDVNWRELQHAFPGHPMFENAGQII